MISKQESFVKTLESLTDDEISSKLFSGRWSIEQKRWATEWLEHKSAFKRDAREEETLSIVKEANAIASEAKEFARLASDSASKQARWAMWAAIIATVAIIIAAMTYIKTP
ncbi:hypothetical protein [Desulfobacterium sp. N47]|uniref:Uncharacterized protein n=1 Tax=uncultured Desulfobacterium sp. TaxID=201089 RepID=E1YKB8_9BACT|nr:unknown protein [uncultured Desulfobacterium sp.]